MNLLGEITSPHFTRKDSDWNLTCAGCVAALG